MSLFIQSWDEGLAIAAQAWARHCIFDHNPRLKAKVPQLMHPTFLSVGENIWTGYPPSSFDVTRAIKKWVDEKEDYNYQTNSCTNVCGHYTQVCTIFFTFNDNVLIVCVCFEIAKSLKGEDELKKKKKKKRTLTFAQLSPFLSPGCVGKQLQGWLCCCAVPRWCR